MRIPGFSGFNRWLKGRQRRAGPRAVILLYHRVHELSHDPQLLSVTPDRFARQLNHLRRNYRVVSLEKLTDTMEQCPDQIDRQVAVTFDDGYADNLIHAKPLLEQYGVPATVFVASGCLQQGREFWWDELESLFLQPSVLPAKLCLAINGGSREWALGNAAQYGHEESAQHRSWTILRQETPTPRHRIYRELCTAIRPLSEPDREKVFDHLREWSGREAPVRETHRALTREEVKQLASGQFVDVGAHTVSHSVLSTLSPEDQKSEIQQSRNELERLTMKPVTSFAYPYGTRSDYTLNTAAIVRDAGFAVACSNIPESVTSGTDRYQLPRFIVRNWEEERFACILDEWFRGNLEAE